MIIKNQIHYLMINLTFHFNQVLLNQLNLISQKSLILASVNLKNQKLKLALFQLSVTNKKINKIQINLV